MAEISDKIIAEEDEIRKSKIPSLRTLKTDTAEYVKREKMSMVDIVAKEAEGRKLKPITKTQTSKSSKTIIVLSVFVVLAAAVSVYFIFLAPKPAEKVENISNLPKPFVVAEQEAEIAVLNNENNPEKFLGDIQTALTNPIRPNSLLYIQFFFQEGESKNIISAKDFFKFAKISAPTGIFSYFDDRFMLAKFYLSKDWPILIFKVNSYDYAFPMMLKWERTMADDFKNIFAFENQDNLEDSFEDREIQNHDARVLSDKNGVSVLFYSFINKDYLVITTSEEALLEIYRRFSLPQYING